MEDLERLHRLCMEGDVEAERLLFRALQRRLSYSIYPLGEKTPFVDKLGQPIHIGEYIVHNEYQNPGIVVSLSPKRIRAVFYPKNGLTSTIDPKSSLCLPPQALEGRVWAQDLQEYREAFFKERDEPRT